MPRARSLSPRLTGVRRGFVVGKRFVRFGVRFEGSLRSWFDALDLGARSRPATVCLSWCGLCVGRSQMPGLVVKFLVFGVYAR